MNEWYRKQTGTKEDEEDFFQHLKRARGEFHKAQYLKIQAVTLYETRYEPYYDVSLTLLDQYFHDFPDEQDFRADCLHLYGRILYVRKLYDKAFVCYREAAYQELKVPTLISGAWLDYPKLIVQLKRTDLYDEAERFLKTQHWILPFHLYTANAVLAVICHERGDIDAARRHKQLSHEAAAMQRSVLRKHPHLGLVEEKDEFLEAAMAEIP